MRWFALTALAAISLASGAFAPAATAAGTPPSVRLFGVVHRTSVGQRDLRFGTADLGLWVTSVGGDFQVDVRRPSYGAWTASQVDSTTGATLRAVPDRMIEPTGGLARFLSVRFVDSRGRVAARKLLAFCPNGESARLNDSGPANQTYPGDCFSSGQFPFWRGIVWGIDSGWAVQPSLSPFGGFGPGPFGGRGPGPGVVGVSGPGQLPPGAFGPFCSGPAGPPAGLSSAGINLNPGSYTATVSITAPYRRLFAIPSGQASVTLSVRVFAQRPPRCGPPPSPGPGNGPEKDYRHGENHAHAAIAVPIVLQPDPATMPNLVATPAWSIAVHRAGRGDLLSFSATIWNAGPAPFSIEGFRRGTSALMDAYEYFFDARGNVVGRAPAGTLYYDNGPGHHHWHLRQLVSYVLVESSGRVVRSQKQSFCLAPTDPVDLTVTGAARGSAAVGPLGFGGSACDSFTPGVIWLREQLPVGWGDTYQQWVGGQAIDITSVPNGRYRLEVQVNPLGLLHETSTADNVAVRVIRLSGRRGARRVSVAPWHGISG